MALWLLCCSKQVAQSFGLENHIIQQAHIAFILLHVQKEMCSNVKQVLQSEAYTEMAKLL